MANRWTIGQDKVRNRADGNVQINKHDPSEPGLRPGSLTVTLLKYLAGKIWFARDALFRALAVSLLFRSCRGQLFKMRNPQ